MTRRPLAVLKKIMTQATLAVRFRKGAIHDTGHSGGYGIEKYCKYWTEGPIGPRADGTLAVRVQKKNEEAEMKLRVYVRPSD
jgi:hypothetical protein